MGLISPTNLSSIARFSSFALHPLVADAPCH